MSGPVWRHEIEGEYHCDECLEEVCEAFLAGEIVDGEIVVERSLCPDCYQASYALVARD